MCPLAKITPSEFLAIPQSSARIANAEVYSTICQRWGVAWATGIEAELRRDNPVATFDDFQKAFPDRHSALTELARRGFDKLLAGVGKQKLQEYQAALLTTGELAQSPRDIDEN